MTLKLFRDLITYHVMTSRQVWEGILRLSETQYMAVEAYSHGSLYALTLHLASVDRRWLAGLKELPDVGHLSNLDYPTRDSVHTIFEQGAADLTAYVNTLTDSEIDRVPHAMPFSVGHTLFHIVNHGTEHRSEILRILNDYGIETFDQDFASYLFSQMNH
jgi:uncharacterized damage-inducible protein DinB